MRVEPLTWHVVVVVVLIVFWLVGKYPKVNKVTIKWIPTLKVLSVIRYGTAEIKRVLVFPPSERFGQFYSPSTIVP